MKLLQKINIKGSKILGIEVNVLSEDNFVYNVTLLIKNKGKLKVEEKKCNVHNLEEVEHLLKGNMPVSLSITGKGLIHRKTEVNGDEDSSQASLIRKVFPNATPDDFFIQQKELDENSLYLSLIRQSLLEKVLKKFEGFKIHLIELLLGPFAVGNVVDYIGQLETQIATSNNVISFNEQKKIIGIAVKEGTENNYSCIIGEERIYEGEIVAYATAFTCMVLNDFGNDSELEEISSKNKEFYNYKLYRLAGVGILAFFFLVLLINYLVFDTYNKKQASLTQEVGKFNSLLAQSEQLENELKDKKGLLEETGLLMQSKLSFYADRLVSIMPPRIVLTELNINPVMQGKLKDKKIEFNKKAIQVRGLTKNTTDINVWMREIRNYEWVGKIEVISYNKEETENQGEFLIEIKIK